MQFLANKLQVSRLIRSSWQTNVQPLIAQQTFSNIQPLIAQQTCLFHNSPKSWRNSGQQPMPVAYYYQSPWRWMLTKWRMYKLKKWDQDFSEREFKRGSVQAIASVASIINDRKLDDLEGLLTPHALAKLRRDILVLWNNDIVTHIGLLPTDVKLAVPTNVHCREFPVTGRKLCDIDMWYMAMKWKERDALLIMDFVARFSRDYTGGDDYSGWTISFFELRKYHVQSYQ